ncbi:phage tail assembly chaperone [Cupriavidus taiwanensis]|uniref:phage tail assembly chaperone n=1 Tax=Cupriavidus taiwanensis TaxID=164546 RepID=UPI00254194B1|nr:phage tail assembly chaperone [Cupriavidus taiwanensis]MDK3025590.1 phage tail assembly chaperone [Cupriavidus taiwanensis]
MTYLFFHDGAFYDSRICGAVIVQEIDPDWDGDGEPPMIDREISPSKIPAGAVPITEVERDAMFAAQTQGKLIQTGADGRPVVVDPPAPTDQQLENTARARRDKLLSDSDWVTFRAIETGQAVPADVAAYRQALRDLPSSVGWPREVVWPTPPAALVS